jgi:hypothetical protein
MQFLFRVERGEIRSIIRDKGVLLAADCSHQLPNLLAAKAEEVHVVADVTGFVR